MLTKRLIVERTVEIVPCVDANILNSGRREDFLWDATVAENVISILHGRSGLGKVRSLIHFYFFLWIKKIH